MTANPYYWSWHRKWLLNVDVFRTSATEGLLGAVPAGSWLPALPDGSSVGAIPGGSTPTAADIAAQRTELGPG